MELNYFKAKNYRNIRECHIPFSPGVNLLLGENAQGKTNVTEGIYLFSRGKSHRGASDKEMTMFSEDGFSIEIGYENTGGQHTLSYTYYKGDRRRLRDGIRLQRVTEMLGNFRSVLFCPDHLTLVKGGPEERRHFLDIGISGAHDSYIRYYSGYKKALEQRNALLKRYSRGEAVDREELFAWSHYLAEYASYIYLYRKEYCENIAKYAIPYLKDIKEEELTLRFVSDMDEGRSVSSREEIVSLYDEIFTSSLQRECAFGSTLFGPMRDDIAIDLGGKEARYFASQGQQRSIVRALKHAEGEVCHEITGERPVYLLDDVLSELDEGRQRFLLEGDLQSQVIITSCTRPKGLPEKTNIIEVVKGEYHVSSCG